jgi:hypothetical protein
LVHSQVLCDSHSPRDAGSGWENGRRRGLEYDRHSAFAFLPSWLWRFRSYRGSDQPTVRDHRLASLKAFGHSKNTKLVVTMIAVVGPAEERHDYSTGT